jgi:hypothetical protein
VVLRAADRVRNGSPVRVAAAVPARVKSGNPVKVARARNGSRVRVALVRVAQVVAHVKNGSRAKVVLVRVGLVGNGSRVRVLVVMIVAQVVVRVKSGSRAKVVLVRVARVVNGSRAKALVVMIVARVKSGSRAKVVLVRVARVVNGNRVKVAPVRVAQVVVRVVNGSRVRVLVVMTAAQVAARVVMTVVRICHKPKRSVGAPKYLLAKVPVSTARTSRLVTAQIEKSRSLTRVRCVAVSSTPIVARRATHRVVVPASSRALSVAMTARCFPLRQHCKSHWPAKCAVQSETVATTR